MTITDHFSHVEGRTHTHTPYAHSHCLSAIMAAFRHMLFPHVEVLHCSLINMGSVDDVD